MSEAYVMAMGTDDFIVEIPPKGENYVAVVKSATKRAIFRTVPFDHRSFADVEAEISILNELGSRGFPAAAPVALPSRAFIERVPDGWFTCFEFAPGECVKAFGPDWNEAMFVQWGETLGHLHALAQDLPEAEARFAWYDDPAVLRLPVVLLGENEALRAYERLIPILQTISPSRLCLVHGDLGLANFHRTPEGQITVFDFDDCCRHEPLYDVATALWPLRNRDVAERNDYLKWMLAGYQKAIVLPNDWEDVLQIMFDWRSVYLFAHFLRKWGASPDEEQVRWLTRMRQQLVTPIQWV